MIDTHTHIYDPGAFKDTSGEVLTRALNAGVSRFILPNVNVESVGPLLELHHAFPACTYTAAGLHPCDATQDWLREIDAIMDAILGEKPVAIGEVGIDLYWDKSTLERQVEVFKTQIDIARENHLPLIIHCRDALDETLDVLERYGKGIPAVFHSFTGTPADVAKIRRIGDYYFGINGVVTFKNAPELRASLPVIGLDRILLETDSPYLAPVPHRGRRNESTYLPAICNCVAATLGIDSDEVSDRTDENAMSLFEL